MSSKSRKRHSISPPAASKRREVQKSVELSWKKGKKSVVTSPKLIIEVYQGDLTQEDTIAIVNTTNRRLKHQIGVALALSIAAGPTLQVESDDWLLANGSLDVGDVAVTGAGWLRRRGVSYILHTVSPSFEEDAGGDETLAEQRLRVVYANLLQKAKELRLASIAFPGLGTGMFKVPPAVSARAALGVVLDAARTDDLGGISLVRFVDLSEPTAKAFACELFDNHSQLVGHVWSLEDKLAVSSSSSSSSSSLALSLSSAQSSSFSGASCSSSQMKNDKNKNANGTQNGIGDEEEEEEEEDEDEDTEDDGDYDEIDDACFGNDDGSTENQNGNGQSSSGASSSLPPPPANNDEEEKACPVCMEDFADATSEDPIQKLEKCGHLFHKLCIQQTFKQTQPQCPICKTWYGIPQGNQPLGSTMRVTTMKGAVPGFDCKEYIQITYQLPGGIQGKEHPRPGVPFTGTYRVGYLPNTQEGQLVLKLLQLAFDHRLTFTVGDSVTTGAKNVVTWNNIHHKTSLHGGSQNFGYPDPTYLTRVQEELCAMGITKDMIK